MRKIEKAVTIVDRVKELHSWLAGQVESTEGEWCDAMRNVKRHVYQTFRAELGRKGNNVECTCDPEMVGSDPDCAKCYAEYVAREKKACEGNPHL